MAHLINTSSWIFIRKHHHILSNPPSDNSGYGPDMTVRSVQQIGRQPEWTRLPNLARTPVNTDDSGQLKARPPWPGARPVQMIRKCCVYIGCFATAHVYAIWMHRCCYLCLPAAANFYIVVSQNVVTVYVAVVYLKWPDACVGSNQNLCCLLSHERHQHIHVCTLIATFIVWVKHIFTLIVVMKMFANRKL